jgi:hypothetical protein
MAERKPPEMKRAGTMAATAAEGGEFLKQAGHDDKGGTRTQKNVRDTVDTLLNPKKKAKVEGEDPKVLKQKLEMTFRIFDKNHDGKIDA